MQRTMPQVFSKKDKWDAYISSQVGRGKYIYIFLNIDTLMVKRLLMKTWVGQIDTKTIKQK